jgi:pimeloyl-ACP methyl ester carboxylesterase
MNTVTSADSTAIAVDVMGDGPPLIMVVGAFNTRATTEPLSQHLMKRFTVFNFDRRGRGHSGDIAPYAVEREIEDIDALIAEAGGAAAVFGYSSGATLALRAAAAGCAISKLVAYEPPFVVDGSRPLLAADLPERLAALVDSGRRGDAVELYQAEAVGMPQQVIAGLRSAPFRPSMEAIAHTLAYDAAIIGDLAFPAEMLSSLRVPVLAITGEHSPALLRTAAEAVANAVPEGSLRVLPGQTHDISPEATAPAVIDFLEAR